MSEKLITWMQQNVIGVLGSKIRLEEHLRMYSEQKRLLLLCSPYWFVYAFLPQSKFTWTTQILDVFLVVTFYPNNFWLFTSLQQQQSVQGLQHRKNNTGPYRISLFLVFARSIITFSTPKWRHFRDSSHDDPEAPKRTHHSRRKKNSKTGENRQRRRQLSHFVN